LKVHGSDKGGLRWVRKLPVTLPFGKGNKTSVGPPGAGVKSGGGEGWGPRLTKTV